jgi:DHA1 family inner membrane transport protein
MASSLAAHGVPPHLQVRALSFVFGGLIFSTVLGVPLATWAGHALSWQGVFVVLSLLSLACIPATLRFIEDRSPGTPIRIGGLLGVLRDAPTSWSVVTTLLQIAGQFVTYTLIALVLTERYGLETQHVSAALLLFGVCGVAGNWLGGRWGDVGSPLRIVWIAVLGLTAVFVALAAIPHSPSAGLVLLGAWAVMAMLFQAPQQKRLLGFAPGMGGLVLALNSSATYHGVSIGSFTSTRAWHAWGTASLPVVSACFLAGAAVSLFFSQRAVKALPHAAG